MPFDETLFESNQMMRDYWNRSTEERTTDYVNDVITEEATLPEDIHELRQLSEQAYKPEAVRSARPTEPLSQAFGPAAVAFSSDVGAIVEPKSTRAASSTNSWIVAGVAVAVLLVLIFFNSGSSKVAPFSRSRSPRSSPRRV